MANMIQNEAENTYESIPVTSQVSPGLSQKDPAAIEAMNNALKLRGRDVVRSGLMGMAAGAQAGQAANNPLSGFIQGIAVGADMPNKVYQENISKFNSAFDAAPFGSTHPEIIASNPAYKIFAGFPTKLALQAIQQIGIDAAKIQAQTESERLKVKAQSEAAYPTKEQAKTYASITGLPEDVVSNMRVSALEDYSKSSAEAPNKKREKFISIQKAFSDRPAVKSWETVKPNVSTIDSISKSLSNTGKLNPQEQSQLLIAFKDIATLGGGAARMTEDTLNIVENKGTWGRLVDAISSGAPVSLSPSEAKDVVNAASYKINAIKDGYRDEKSKFSGILLKDDPEAQRFVFDESVDESTPSSKNISSGYKPGDFIYERVDGKTITWQITPKGTKVRVE